MCVMPGDRQGERGDQIMGGPVVVDTNADGQALLALGDEGHDRSGGRRLWFAWSAGGRKQDTVDRRRLVGPRMSGDQRSQLSEQEVGGQRGPSWRALSDRSHERNIHLVNDPE